METSCIDMDTLADYLAGNISAEEKERVECHLSECDECREDFVIANTLLRDDTLSPREAVPQTTSQSLWEQIREKISTLCEWSLALPSEVSGQPWFDWIGTAQAVRSGNSSPLEYALMSRDVDDLRAEIFVEKTAPDTADIIIRVLRDGEDAQNVRLILIQKGIPLVSRLMNSNSTHLRNLAFGTYRLAFAQNALEKGELFLTISEAGIDEK